MELLSNKQIDGNLRRTAEKGYISSLNKQKLEELALKYFGIKDSNNKYIGYMCPYSGKIYSKKSNLVLEHIVPVDSKGGTVLFNCIPTSKEVNGSSEKGVKHLISWWTSSKFWDNEAPKRLEKLVNYILEAYNLVFKEYSVEEIEESYQEVLETNDDLTTSKRQNKKLQEQTQSNNIHSYLGFLLDCIKQLEKENINTVEINIKLKELEEKNIFKDIEKYTLCQNILKQVIIKFIGDDTKSYLTYSIKFDIKKIMDSIDCSNEQEIYNEIYSRILNIQEFLAKNNLVIEEYFNSLKTIENINLVYNSINSISEEEKQEFLKNIKLGIETKVFEFINLLNTGYIPKAIDKHTKFSNGELINYFWSDYKDRLKEILYDNEKYKIGYELAKETIKNLEIDKISEFIEKLNQGYVPKHEDKETKFSNGDLINNFWSNHKEKIVSRIKTDLKYQKGYDKAKEIIYNIENPIDKISEFIEKLNQGYVPKHEDKETKFSNGKLVNQFWRYNKEKIKEILNNDEKYKEGYDKAKEIIYIIENPIDKISEYIELLNNGYIPKSYDNETKFSNGDLINHFFDFYQEKIKEELETNYKYQKGYDKAKEIIEMKSKDKRGKGLKPSIKKSEYIELLNDGYVPKAREKNMKFSNGDLINSFWISNKDKIKEILNNDEKYKYGYDVAKEIIRSLEIDKISEYIELLNDGYIPKSLDNEIKFSNNDSINQFWPTNKENIKKRLETDEKYRYGYEKAKLTIYNIENPIDKISEFIEKLNKGYIPKYEDKETKFSNGDIINQYWSKNRKKIKEKLEFDAKYQIGYEQAKEIIKHAEIDKISEYIELMNKGYIPQKKDEKTKFSNGDLINSFWPNNKKMIKERIKTEEKYKVDYDVAKKIIKNMETDKLLEFIELLNLGYNLKSIDLERKFSNGELIKRYWRINKDKIIIKIFCDLKDNPKYNKARETILKYFKVNAIEEYYELEQKKKQLKELKNMKQNLETVDNSLEINETISRKRA